MIAPSRKVASQVRTKAGGPVAATEDSRLLGRTAEGSSRPISPPIYQMKHIFVIVWVCGCVKPVRWLTLVTDLSRACLC